MIADNEKTATVTSTLVGETIAMSVDQASMGYIMRSLTNLYSDPELAVIREYATNGFDAHIEAGQSRPIEITLPSALSPFLTVKDFGVGLSVEDIHDIYSKYGASTKRETNDQVGMLGFGCKSALAYSSQFTLVAVKDGVRTQVAISRDENGGGSMTVIDTSTTSDPNGVEVVVPAKADNRIEQKANEFFSYWTPGTVLVNGREPSRYEGLAVTPTLTLTRGTLSSYVVMGNVAYPWNANSYQFGLPNGYHVVAHVEIGDVHFTPSRESLEYTAKTTATADRLISEFKDALPGAIQKQIDGCETPRAALEMMLHWKGAGQNNTYTYKGDPIPYMLQVQKQDAQMTIVPRDSTVLSRHDRYRSTNIEGALNSVFFYGYDRPSFTPAQKKKINLWSEEHPTLNSLSFRSYILMEEKPDPNYIDSDKVFDWAEVQAVKLPRNAPGASGRIPGSYDMYRDGTIHESGVPADEINTEAPIFYTLNTSNCSAAEILASAHDEFTLVCFNYTREAKFLRNFPDAKPVNDEIETIYQSWLKTVNATDKKALALSESYGVRDILLKLPEGIKDPEVLAAIKLANVDLARFNAKRKMFSRVRQVTFGDSEWENPLERYPLLDRSAAHYYPDHVLIYMNAAYESTLPASV